MTNFIIVCNKNVLYWKNIWPMYMKGEIGYGYNMLKHFYLPDDAEQWFFIKDGRKVNDYHSTGRWLTNFKTNKHNTPMPLVEYKGQYKNFDEYDAINIDRITKIPDYDGVMGVPVGIIDYLCPEQFEILGELHTGAGDDLYDFGKPKVGGVDKYIRIIIKRK